MQRCTQQQQALGASAASVPRESPAPIAEIPASVYPSISSLAGGKPRHPHACSRPPPVLAAAVMQSPCAICHTNPSLTAYPFFSLCAPSSAQKHRGVKEHKNSCGDEGARLSPGLEPGQGARSHLQAIFGLDLVSKHLTGSRRKPTQAGGRAGPAPRLISTADSQMLICHFRSRVKEIKGQEGKNGERA